MKNKPCHCCNGSGAELDPVKAGKLMSKLRTKAGIGLRDMARRIGISHSFLSQLEAGKRKWLPHVSHSYMLELEKEDCE